MHRRIHGLLSTRTENIVLVSLQEAGLVLELSAAQEEAFAQVRPSVDEVSQIVLLYRIDNNNSLDYVQKAHKYCMYNTQRAPGIQTKVLSYDVSKPWS